MKYLLDQDHLLDYDSYRDQISESKKDFFSALLSLIKNQL